MKLKIEKGQWWKYFGPGDGKGMKHMITGIEDGNVTTCSEPSRDPEEGGMMWDGPADVFI
jgi:hypothetical protein